MFSAKTSANKQKTHMEQLTRTSTKRYEKRINKIVVKVAKLSIVWKQIPQAEQIDISVLTKQKDQHY